MSTAELPPPAEPLAPLPLDIEEELKESYLNYAMSVIISRALPDVRDGLKPSQRRILVAMRDLGLNPASSTSKCAGIVGETMKRYHPHGDNSIYPTLARMAQWWNMRHLLITGQGNFGSIHGLPPAAMRYTEAKLSPVAADMLEDIKLDTVDFQPNYDEKYQEPRVLPGKFPNLLVNGSGGIAVGMATSIPPHNLGEVCDALIAYIDNPTIELDEIMEIMPGPDFPTGGTICGRFGIKEAYLSGRGRVVVRARSSVEEQKDGRAQIVFSDIPYQLTKEPLLKKLADLVNGGRITGVSDIVDESDRKQPVRIVVKLKKGEEPTVVLNQLYEFSPLQDTFSVIMLALVDGRPKTLPLKATLAAVRRAPDQRDPPADSIPASPGPPARPYRRGPADCPAPHRRDHPRDPLIGQSVRGAHPAHGHGSFGRDLAREPLNDPEAKASTSLTRMQADAILAMQLQRLTGLEADKLAQEYTGLKTDIAGYEAILADEGLILDLIRADLRELKDKYANPRRSAISDEELGDYDKEALIREEYMVVTVTHDGFIKRQLPSTYRAQGRGGRGITATNTREGDFLEHMFVALTHDYILLFTDHGKVYWIKVYDLPMATRTSGGRAMVNLLQLAEGEKVTGVVPVREFRDDECLMMVTRRGTVKKTELKAFRRPLGRGIIALGLEEGDQLIGVARIKTGDQVILSTRSGMAIRFDESDVRPMGRPAHGVKGITLDEQDEVVGMVVANGGEDPASLLTVCSNGYGKRTMLTEYRSQNRGGKGLIDIKTSDRNGSVVAVTKVTDADEVMLTTTRGILIRTRVDDTRPIGRNTQGVRLIRLDEGDTVGSLAKLPEEELTAVVALEPVDLPDGDLQPGVSPSLHILDDGVAEAEASDHLDDEAGEPETEEN